MTPGPPRSGSRLAGGGLFCPLDTPPTLVMGRTRGVCPTPPGGLDHPRFDESRTTPRALSHPRLRASLSGQRGRRTRLERSQSTPAAFPATRSSVGCPPRRHRILRHPAARPQWGFLVVLPKNPQNTALFAQKCVSLQGLQSLMQTGKMSV